MTSFDFKSRMEHSFVLLILIAATGYRAACGSKTFTRDTVKVKSGAPIDVCLEGDCSPNANVDCIITNGCDNLGTSDTTAQGVDIEDVYFEKYYASMDGHDKLALHVQWSFIDNASSNYLKGFKIDISNGETQYSTCYRVNTTLDWKSIKSDIFFNDCFGKSVGTVRPGSNLTFSITPLPLNKIDDSQKTSFLVEVPNCTNEDLHSLPECEAPGGRPTSRPCMENCSTISVVNADRHDVRCRMSDLPFSLDPTLLASSCPKGQANNGSGTPSSPVKHVNKQDWYKYIDPVSKEVKLALNFTWKPRPDSSIRDLSGYEITILPPGNPSYTKCFAIQTKLIEIKHREASFYYDCFGRSDDRPVELGHTYTVRISSIPSGSMLLPMEITIPTCADPRVEDVKKCIDDKNRRLSVKVEQIYCSNRTLRVSYFATKEYGEDFDIRFCESGTEDRTSCKVMIDYVSTTERNGTIYKFSLPSNSNLSIGYNVFIHANGLSRRSFDYPDFKVCIPPVSGATVGFIVAICVIAVALATFAIWFCFFRKKCGFWIFKRKKPPRPEYHVSARNPPGDTNEIPVTLPGRAKVYVVFADDHELHRNVIHWFCSFLQRDLGLTVKVHIWELNTTAFSRPQYIFNNLQDSDKVVVICSEGSNPSLENTEVGNMYAPVVRQLCADSLAARNPEKYVIGYFSYTKAESIPDMLRSHIKMYSPAFKLIDQLEQFYFRLLGIEQYQDQGILKINEIDQFFEPERMSESALKLQHAISKMTELTRINPTWYEDLHNYKPDVEVPLHPIAKMPTALQQYESIMDFQGGESSITHLITATPPPLRNDKEEHIRPPKAYIAHNGTANASRPIYQQPPPQNQVNITQAAARSPPKQNGGPVGYHVESEAVRLTSPTRRPAEHASREPCEHDAAYTSADASFEISESEDLNSLAPSKQTSHHAKKQASSTAEFEQSRSAGSIVDTNVSFHPESFNTGDFSVVNELENGYDSQVLTFLPSASTEATDIDEPSLQHQSEEVDRLMNNPVVRKPSTSNSPESGLFSLAVIDEEDDLDLEDQIKSINLSANF